MLDLNKLAYDRYRAKKFFDGLQSHGGIVGDKAVLLIYNPKAPELSYLLVQQL